MYYKLVQSYLHNRTYSVKIGNTLSKLNLIKSSLPQGTVLGPYLYLIYRNDFPRTYRIKLAHFEDNVVVKAETNLLVSQNIQQLTTPIEEWCLRWSSVVLHKSTESSKWPQMLRGILEIPT